MPDFHRLSTHRQVQLERRRRQEAEDEIDRLKAELRREPRAAHVAIWHQVSKVSIALQHCTRVTRVTRGSMKHSIYCRCILSYFISMSSLVLPCLVLFCIFWRFLSGLVSGPAGVERPPQPPQEVLAIGPRGKKIPVHCATITCQIICIYSVSGLLVQL